MRAWSGFTLTGSEEDAEPRIKLKYVTKPQMKIEEARKIMKQYRKNKALRLESDEVTLRDYLEVVKVIYEANSFDVSGDLKELYRRYSDGRDCGLADLPLEDKKAFTEWREHGCIGGHPFEVIRGGLISYGVHLYPPRRGKYTIYAEDQPEFYINAVKEFLRRKIPFRAPDLIRVLKFLTGEAVVKVNELNERPKILIFHSEVKRKDKIRWEELEEVRYRRKEFREKKV